MNDVCIYTCITGGYDKLKDPVHVDPSIDYICFTDNSNLQSDVWKITPVPENLKDLSQVKKQRVIKICPHRYLPKQYDVSLWIDGNIKITGDIRKLISIYDLEKCPLYTRVHPRNKDVYEEIELCRSYKKEADQMLDTLKNRYTAENYPHNTGMHETNVILRRHSDRTCRKIDDAWAVELMLNSHRDQLSFDYICWKNRFTPGCLSDLFMINQNEYMRLSCHG